MKPTRKCKTIAGEVERAMLLGAAARGIERTEALAELEAREERERLLFGPRNVFEPGDRIVLTATACRTWAAVMGYPVTRSLTAVWTVIACDCELCNRGDHVCTDEALEHDLVDTDVSGPVMRHISVMQVKRKGELRADDGLSSGPDQPRIGHKAKRQRTK